ncbi:Holliday junction resolvase RuvX [Mycoplasmopsis gallopavonis]|uniref:Putative pre-16S rRNA nuclease n=1 Tax=Mycoplasmopsis gallopavonis TaxID=76629 RepID=A0A449AZA9_9BACT|nr:Holliday junction resolvase RuvX [Mycoplasmopsis gallopavonis]RIV16441.1 Holliday junction resolvase RuvX [Mycoplasmopsis gallopavonis]VEU72832.1 Putative Holliday junction resolvase [Mycoplasmopsis gallopavonis]
MRKLGLDLGTKTCGFAITDLDEIIATSLENYHFSENDFEQALLQVEHYLSVYNNKIDGIVLGYPLKISGDKSERTLMVEAFRLKLIERFNLPVMLVNEQYSTKRATEVMLNAGLTRQKRKNHKDKLAAQIILQDYLEYYKNKWDLLKDGRIQ